MVGAGTDQFNLVISHLEMLKISDSDFDSLPDDMLIQILIRVPAQDIHDAAMFVCRKWHHTILTGSFIYTHLHHSTPGLLMASSNTRALSTLLSSTKGGIQCTTSDFSSDYKRAYCLTNCNGLMLKRDLDDNLKLTIVNPLTKQHLDLPRFYSRIGDSHQFPTTTSAIAYDATRMEYKVFRTYYLRAKCVFCAVLTVGVDKSWRRVRTKHLSLTAREHLMRRGPLVTEGFVHWARESLGFVHWTREYSSSFVLSLNIETEVIARIPVPSASRGCCYYLAGGGSCLSLLVRRGLLLFEVWEMKPETGEWTKLPDIDLGGDCLVCVVRPGGWLKYREIIVFVAYDNKRDLIRVVYNIQTRDIYELKSAASGCTTPYVVHKNSLVRIPG